jgi:lsr operon transcriptional repressor
MSTIKTSKDITGSGGGEAEDFDAALAARVCWLYYKDGQTQESIAQRLGITRKRVNRLIGLSLETGLVQITIDSRVAPYAELEAGLVAKFSLAGAVVVPSPPPDTDVRAVVGAAAGRLISEQLGAQETLGISWGGTIAAAAQNVIRRQGTGNVVVSLVGGLASSGPINPYDNAAMMARALGAQCRYVTAPMIADTRQLRDALKKSAQVSGILDHLDRIDMALLSAVDLTEQSRALEYGVIDKATWRSLRAAGCVGDICGTYLGADGREIAHEICSRIVAPDLASIRKIPRLVLAAGGVHKVPLIKAGILARLCTLLVTDETAARALMK